MTRELQRTKPDFVACERPWTLLIRAEAVADAAGEVRPGTALVHLSPSSQGGTEATTLVLAVGADAEQRASEADQIHDLPGHVLTPGFVNAHTHLDLTHLGPHPHDPAEGFTGFAKLVMGGRLADTPELAESVRLGITKSLAGGVVAVGDIAGVASGSPTLTPWRTLRDSPLIGTSFLEFFSIGAAEQRATEQVEAILRDAEDEIRAHNHADGRSARFGLQPHAPYSVNRASYRRTLGWSARFDPALPVSTHLAETMDEREFIAEGSGPKLHFLRTIGVLDEDQEARERADIGKGAHPIEHLRDILSVASQQGAPALVAHVNDAPRDTTGEAINTLARTNTSVAYCPRSSAYFNAPAVFGPHRYRDMLAAGVNVCLGTDSIINLDTSGHISPLDDARLLVRRDGLDPALALGLITTHGACALGLRESLFRLQAGSLPAGLVAVPGASLAAAMISDAAPQLLLVGNRSCLVGIGSP